MSPTLCPRHLFYSHIDVPEFEPTPTRRRLGDPLESDSHTPNWPGVRREGSVGGYWRPKGGLQAIQMESWGGNRSCVSTSRAPTVGKLPRLRSSRIEDADREPRYPKCWWAGATAGPVPDISRAMGAPLTPVIPVQSDGVSRLSLSQKYSLENPFHGRNHKDSSHSIALEIQKRRRREGRTECATVYTAVSQKIEIQPHSSQEISISGRPAYFLRGEYGGYICGTQVLTARTRRNPKSWRPEAEFRFYVLFKRIVEGGSGVPSPMKLSQPEVRQLLHKVNRGKKWVGLRATRPLTTPHGHGLGGK
ncbi:hypothetical protein C8R47DRAFT_1073180 [Mycena vitilis]|nr:hypothetical protein C8R47DRAFT_1073180 [Mycena vitilis]